MHIDRLRLHDLQRHADIDIELGPGLTVVRGPNESGKVEHGVRPAVVFALLGLLCIFIFLARGFNPWSLGIALFLGVPLLLVGLGLYVVAVVRDLRRHGVL